MSRESSSPLTESSAAEDGKFTMLLERGTWVTKESVTGASRGNGMIGIAVGGDKVITWFTGGVAWVAVESVVRGGGDGIIGVVLTTAGSAVGTTGGGGGGEVWESGEVNVGFEVECSASR